MALVTCGAMKELEEAAFQRGVVAEDLMDLAGMRLGEFVHAYFAKQGTAIAYLGKGNNGGDALVALRVLRNLGWEVRVRSAFDKEELGPLPQKKLKELGLQSITEGLGAVSDLPRPLVSMDGLVGIGAVGPLREPLTGLAEEMNQLRKKAGARTVAIDLPSGIDGDTGEVYAGAVVADVTCTLGVAKKGLVADSAIDAVGRLELLPLEDLLELDEGKEKLVTVDWLRSLFPPRAFSSHKGMAGRVGVVAGSRDYLGAAVLATTGALRGGAGLVSLFIDDDLCASAHAAGLPSEVIVRPISKVHNMLDQKFDALVIGPGLGGCAGDKGSDLLGFLRSWEKPVVVDADALNLIALEQAWDALGSGSLLTPHPGEMSRLISGMDGLSRVELATKLAEVSGAAVLFKGARTVITDRSGAVFYNTTGTPAMATGGQGDLLSGLLGALMAQGQSPISAACAGAWLCGRAAEISLAYDGNSEQSLLPSDVAKSLGRAFQELRGQF